MAKEPVHSFVEGLMGRRDFMLDELEDGHGLYVVLASQGAYHGNDENSSKEMALPILRGVERLSQEQLVRYCKSTMRDYRCTAACLEESRKLWDDLASKWRKDLGNIGGSLPNGRPNSPRLGVQRSSGISYGEFCCAVRRHPMLRKMWNGVCMAEGRDRVDPDGPACTSFDGMLLVTNEHKYKGLQRHIDVYAWEPGQLTALVVLHPPPAGLRRLGIAVQYYNPTAHLWRRQAVAMVCRWSQSPDMDLRMSPLPNLGSTRRKGGHSVLGGPRVTKAEANAMSNEELQRFVLKLPGYLRTLLPLLPNTETATHGTYLKEKGFQPLDDQALKRALSTADESVKRELLLRAIAGGMSPTAATSRSLFSTGVLTQAPKVIDRCILYGSPEKLTKWCELGGRHKRQEGWTLQPSGNVTAKEKGSPGRSWQTLCAAWCIPRPAYTCICTCVDISLYAVQ
jgi:hypothetical protein